MLKQLLLILSCLLFVQYTSTAMVFKVFLREGIVGGFAGPTVKQVVEISGDSNGAVIAHSTLKPGSKFDYHQQSGEVTPQEIHTLLGDLHSQLKQLPLESPIGSDDIYGRDISLGFFTDEFQWQNGGPEGCTRSPSSTQATEQQKAVFNELVERVLSLSQRFAIKKQD
ncbi:hypothetical protein BGW37DRAFT_489157 [Umbelopsis sp. PMI_123]|nr:hypothetical protein BGW37DRAFT_489157 [Umbelopsis sp. PMI_123]